MSSSRNLLAPLVSAAVALIIVSNFCIVHLVQRAGTSPIQLAGAVWPIALPTTIAIVLVMSTLYQSLIDLLSRLERNERDAVELALRDPLTGLANKRLIDERIADALATKRRRSDGFAVLMIDLDHFKRINDVLGHQSGDEVLKIVASRLQALVREGDTVARFGGDEFLILAKIASSEELHKLCRRIIAEMQKPYPIAGEESSLPASIGAVSAGGDLHTAEEYVRAADVALYAAKGDGRNCFRIFTDELDERLKRRSRLEADLRRCLASGERICVHYQPQIDAGGAAIGVECLFRWTHSYFGQIPAIEAIEIAEESRQIDALGDFVLNEACRFAKAHPSLSVAINVSPAQFGRANGMLARFQSILAEHEVETSQIELEITEQLFMRQDPRCEEQIAELRSAGFRLALDDFGTGYSSLSHLRRFKVDRLKLDRSLSSDGRAEDRVAIIKAAVTLAHTMGLEVIAEGVETKEHEAIALEAGCDALQGHRYAGATDYSGIETFLGKWVQKAA